MKHSSSPGAMYSPAEAQERGSANVSRSKSDVSTRKNPLSEYSFGHLGYKRTESSPEVVMHFYLEFETTKYFCISLNLPVFLPYPLCLIYIVHYQLFILVYTYNPIYTSHHIQKLVVFFLMFEKRFMTEHLVSLSAKESKIFRFNFFKKLYKNIFWLLVEIIIWLRYNNIARPVCINMPSE
jgi:hypothetical protein